MHVTLQFKKASPYESNPHQMLWMWKFELVIINKNKHLIWCTNTFIPVLLHVLLFKCDFISLFHREYLGRQLQSTDQQQAPAVAARSWTIPCTSFVCPCGWAHACVAHSGLSHFNIWLYFFVCDNLKIKQSSFLPLPPCCYLIWLSCRACPVQSCPKSLWWYIKKNPPEVI